MIKTLTLIALIFTAQAKADESRYACVFRKMTVIGSSITANIMVRNPLMWSFKAAGYDAFDWGPAAKLKMKFAPSRITNDFSAKFGSPTGAEQIAMLINSADQPRTTQASRLAVSNSTSIVGIDAFYWDAIKDTCEENLPQLLIPKLTEYAKDRGIVLVLGTLPYEDPEKVWWQNNMIWARDNIGTWYEPVRSCVSIINDLVIKNCKSENQCYTVRVDQMVETLNAGKLLRLDSGKECDLQGMRPDGVHLSQCGSQYLTEQILHKLTEDPLNVPECSKYPNGYAPPLLRKNQ